MITEATKKYIRRKKPREMLKNGNEETTKRYNKQRKIIKQLYRTKKLKFIENQIKEKITREKNFFKDLKYKDKES